MIVPTYPALVPRINGSEIRHGIFWEVLFEALGIFLGLIFDPIPVT